MTKKDLARILILHKKGFDRKMCIQAIIETEKSSYLAAQAIDEFMASVNSVKIGKLEALVFSFGTENSGPGINKEGSDDDTRI